MKFIPNTSSEAIKLSSRIKSTNRSVAFFDLEKALDEQALQADLTNLLDQVAQANGLLKINRWYEITEQTAKWMMTNLLNSDMAYHSELFARDESVRLSNEFVQFVSQGETVAKNGIGCRYFINGSVWTDAPSLYTLDGKEILGWNSVTNATFDSCILMVTPQRIGIVWGKDQD